MLRYRSTQSLLGALGLTTALLAVPQASHAQALDQALYPPDFDYSAICRPDTGLSVDEIGYTDWSDGPPPGTFEQIMAAAALYRTGSAQTGADPQLALRLYRFVADQPSREAMNARYYAGQLLLETTSTESGRTEALDLLRTAAEARVAGAARALGRLYEDGTVVPQDLAEAARFHRIAAAGNQEESAIALARLYGSGEVEEPTPGMAEQMVQLGVIMMISSLNSGDCSALLSMARLYDAGQVVPQDQDVASAWYLAAAEAGDERGMLEMGERYAGGVGTPIDVDAALRWWQAAYDVGNMDGAFKVGELYAYGDGIPADAALAREWLGYAAEGGDVPSMIALYQLAGAQLPATRGQQPNYDNAADWLIRAMALDPTRIGVINDLARAYRDGRGVELDQDRAVQLFSRSMTLGSTTGLLEVARATLYGRGVEQDPQRALSLFKQAASRGDEGAFNELIEMYRCGTGVDRDVAAADRWLDRAAGQRVHGALRQLADRALADGSAEALSERRMLLLRGAAGRDREAMVLLARAYWRGEGVEPDPEQVTRWLGNATAPGENRFKGYAALSELAPDLPGAAPHMAQLLDVLKDSSETDQRAALALARAYLSGEVGLARDAGAAVEILEPLLGVETGVHETLARAYLQTGETERAIETLERGVAAGDIKSRLELAEWALEGLLPGGPDQDLAIELVADLRSTAPCSPSTAIALGDLLAEGLGGETAQSEVFALVDHTINQLDPDLEERTRLVRTAIKVAAPGETGDRVVAMAEDAANAGQPEAMVMLARIYADGVLVSADPQTSLDWYQAAAETGAPKALYEIGLAHASGLLGDVDPDAAWAAMETAAGSGLPKAKRELARWHFIGFGPSPDPDAGFTLLSEAGEAGDTDAMLELANLYTVGLITDKDDAAAISWLTRAAELGEGEAMLRLGVAYASGFGVEADAAQSEKWLGAARQIGFMSGEVTQ